MQPLASHPADRRFHASMSVVAAVVIVTGFANTFGPRVVMGATLVPAFIRLHAALFACWLALFIAQTPLVVRGQVLAHTRVGQAGMVLAGLLLAILIVPPVVLQRSATSAWHATAA